MFFGFGTILTHRMTWKSMLQSRGKLPLFKITKTASIRQNMMHLTSLRPTVTQFSKHLEQFREMVPRHKAFSLSRDRRVPILLVSRSITEEIT